MGGGGETGGRKSEGAAAETDRKRPERPWTAATRTMEVLKGPITLILSRKYQLLCTI